ncbi:response regulator [Chloroflexia bacterium SDU3-3]|nr:response regulator [Chloroflexia bacterium SDU3-3]
MTFPVDPADVRVAIIDDNDDNSYIAWRCVLEAGVPAKHCDIYAQGQAFLEAGKPYDVILLDIMLPVLDGFELLLRIRSSDLVASATVIAMSASMMRGDVLRYQQAGFDGIIGKPYDPDEMPDRLRDLFAGQPVWSR